MALESPGLEINVWRPARLTAKMFQVTEEAETASWTRLAVDAKLLESVYQWSTTVDIWGGFLNSDKTEQVRTLLLRNFDPRILPEKRLVADLKSATAALKALASTPGELDWQDCESIGTNYGEDDTSRMNTALALLQQLSWIERVFKNVPDASVTIR
jgi:hypothetical protein